MARAMNKVVLHKDKNAQAFVATSTWKAFIGASQTICICTVWLAEVLKVAVHLILPI